MLTTESLNIVCIGLPAAHFNSQEAIDEFRDEAEKYESAVRDYESDGDDATFWEALSALGFDAVERQKHIDNPGIRMQCGYFAT
jgi:hypothetical protein